MIATKHVLTSILTAAVEGAQTTLTDIEGLIEVVALFFARFQDRIQLSGAVAQAPSVAPGIETVVTAETDAVVATSLYGRLGAFADWAFSPIFDPMNRVLAGLYEPWAQIVVILFFVGTWLWVAFVLKKEYVNLSSPYKSALADLRIWTLVAMAPHLFVYLYFR